MLLQPAMDDSACIELLRIIRVLLLEGHTCLQALSDKMNDMLEVIYSREVKVKHQTKSHIKQQLRPFLSR